MLEFRNVTGIGKNILNKRKFILKDVSFTAETGYITGITGVNGAGKTTLFHYIIDRNAQYTGEILYNGVNIRDNFDDFKNHMAFISDEKRFFEDFSISDNINLLSGFFTSWDDELFKDNLKSFGIPLGRKLSALSRGEYLKFQLAFSLAHNATLYLLDEATAGMDPVFRKDFFNTLHELIAKEDVTILMTTHIEEEISIHMDYKGILEDGYLIEFKEVEVK